MNRFNNVLIHVNKFSAKRSVRGNINKYTTNKDHGVLAFTINTKDKT